MKHLTTTSALSALLLSPVAAQAGEKIGNTELSANVGFVSEYSFRGITQTDEDPALQGGFDAEHDSGVYAGVWGSNVDFDDGDEAQLEVDIYGGYQGGFDNFSYDVGVIYYAYPGADDALDYDFVEGAVSVGYDFEVLSASTSVNYSPEYFGDSGDALYYAGNVDVPLPANFNLTGHIGHQEIDDNGAFGVPDYTDWSVGLGYTLAGFDLSVQYIDTDLNEPGDCADGCDARAVFGVSRSF